MPSIPAEFDDLKSRIILTMSMSASSLNSNTGGLGSRGAGFSFRCGIFDASLEPISAKNVFKMFAISSGSHSSLILVILVFFDIMASIS